MQPARSPHLDLRDHGHLAEIRSGLVPFGATPHAIFGPANSLRSDRLGALEQFDRARGGRARLPADLVVDSIESNDARCVAPQ